MPFFVEIGRGSCGNNHYRVIEQISWYECVEARSEHYVLGKCTKHYFYLEDPYIPNINFRCEVCDCDLSFTAQIIQDFDRNYPENIDQLDQATYQLQQSRLRFNIFCELRDTFK